MKKVDFDEYSESYNQLLAERTGFFSSGSDYFARYKVELIRKQITTPVERLLEYGCGIGRNIPFIKKAFPNSNVVGSDISKASLEIARRDNPGTDFILEEESVNSIGAFDLIIVTGVFHHIPVHQRIQVAQVLRNRLSPDGQLFIFEHNPFNPVTRRIVSHCPYDEDAVLLRPAVLRRILAKASLTVVNKAYCLFFPPRFQRLLRLEYKLGWLPLGGQYWLRAKRAF